MATKLDAIMDEVPGGSPEEKLEHLKEMLQQAENGSLSAENQAIFDSIKEIQDSNNPNASKVNLSEEARLSNIIMVVENSDQIQKVKREVDNMSQEEREARYADIQKEQDDFKMEEAARQYKAITKGDLSEDINAGTNEKYVNYILNKFDLERSDFIDEAPEESLKSAQPDSTPQPSELDPQIMGDYQSNYMGPSDMSEDPTARAAVGAALGTVMAKHPDMIMIQYEGSRNEMMGLDVPEISAQAAQIEADLRAALEENGIQPQDMDIAVELAQTRASLQEAAPSANSQDQEADQGGISLENTDLAGFTLLGGDSSVVTGDTRTLEELTADELHNSQRTVAPLNNP